MNLNLLEIGFYGWSAGIILFLITWLALNLHRFGIWVVVVGTTITLYLMLVIGGKEYTPASAMLVMICLLYVAHFVTYKFVLSDEQGQDVE